MKDLAGRLYNFFKSLKLAAVVLSAWAVLTAVGTFVESRYDQQAANKLVYHSPWMGVVMLFLALNLFVVLLDRWPWKKRHAGFVMAHTGILTVLLGSLVTKYAGVDGSLRFREGESVRAASLQDMEVKIYSSYDGKKFSLLRQRDVDFFLRRPSKKKPFKIAAGAGGEFVVDSYMPYAAPRRIYKPSKKGTPAIRFHLEGKAGAFSSWLYVEPGESLTVSSLGPVSISLTTDSAYKGSLKGGRELVLFSKGGRLFYFFSDRKRRRPPKISKKKAIKAGGRIQTPWMDFQFRALEFLPRAAEGFLFTPLKSPSDKTVQAARVLYKGHAVWAAENSHTRFYTDDRVYVFSWLSKKADLGFELKLLDFRMENYQGSGKAKSYESEVEAAGERRIISMNEPLKREGYTFYQASFEKDEDGAARVSILSVNRDPGRPLKYGGSALAIGGIALLFYRRRLRAAA